MMTIFLIWSWLFAGILTSIFFPEYLKVFGKTVSLKARVYIILGGLVSLFLFILAINNEWGRDWDA